MYSVSTVNFTLIVEVIIRDRGCDLGIAGYEIVGKAIIHHMNPMTRADMIDDAEVLLNPEYLICVSMETHNALHYGDERIIKAKEWHERKPNDTCPWR